MIGFIELVSNSIVHLTVEDSSQLAAARSFNKVYVLLSRLDGSADKAAQNLYLDVYSAKG